MEISNHVAGVVATDISPGMIALLQRKVDAKGAGRKVSVLKLGAAGKSSKAARSLPGGKTRLAYSFNGALNCEPSIESVPSELAKVIEQGGYFVCSVRNTLCLSEALVHGLFLQFDRMAPRKRQPIMVSVGGQDIPSYYYPPSKFARFFVAAVQGKEDDRPTRHPPARLPQRSVLQGEGRPCVRREGRARRRWNVPVQPVRRSDALRLPEEPERGLVRERRPGRAFSLSSSRS